MKRTNSFQSNQLQSSLSSYNLPPIPEEPILHDTFNLNSPSNNSSRIKVVIRVRPLTFKEKSYGEKVIAQDVTSRSNDLGNESACNVQSRSIAVWDPACFALVAQQQQFDLSSLDSNYWAKTFHFDRILWSIDQLSPSYSSQSTVFDELGQPVIDMAMNGYNCCVMAFGQTGSGKTYTMSNVANQMNPNEFGLIPRICFGLFEALEMNLQALEEEENYDSTGAPPSDINVTFSHIEIYNDSVRDLLAAPSANPSHNQYLKVREHPQKGVFVAGLTVVKVSNFEDVMSLIAIGDKNRTIAVTNANAHSSRSHAIVNLIITQRSRSRISPRAEKEASAVSTKSKPLSGKKLSVGNNNSSSGYGKDLDIYLPTSEIQQKVSKVYLVDLAGSERVAFSGAKGDRLKEANHINVSLSVLGDVIKSLGDLTKKSASASSKGSSDSSKSSGFIPYRNSTLTMVLKESLGGNSHAIMVCAVSPSSSDYEETLSTLKYADRAKRVKLQVKANITSGLLASAAGDSAALALVPLLQAEVRKLRELLQIQQMAHSEMEILSINGSNLSSTPRVSSVTFLEHQLKNQSEEQPTQQSASALEAMRERVKELEEQLAERERLIAALESQSQGAGLDSVLTTTTAEMIQSQNREFNENGDNNSVNLRTKVASGAGSSSSSSSPSDSDQSRFKSPHHVRNHTSLSQQPTNAHQSVMQMISTTEDLEKLTLKADNNDSAAGRNAKIVNPEGGHTPAAVDGVKKASHARVDHDALSQSLVEAVSIYNSPQRSGSESPAVVLNAMSSHTVASSAVSPRTPQVVLAHDAHAVDSHLPRVINLNQDPLFSEVLIYYISGVWTDASYSASFASGAPIIVGSKVMADILLSGPDIMEKHSLLQLIYDDEASCFAQDSTTTATSIESEGSRTDRAGTVWLRPFPGALVFVNGEMLPSPAFAYPLAEPAATAVSESVGSGSPSISSSEKSANLSIVTSSRSKAIASSYLDNDETDAVKQKQKVANMKQGRALRHLDRVAFGRFHLFRFEDSAAAVSLHSAASVNKSQSISYDHYTAGEGSNSNRSFGGSNSSGSKSLNPNTAPRRAHTHNHARTTPGWDFAQEELLIKNSAAQIMSIPSPQDVQLLLSSTQQQHSSRAKLSSDREGPPLSPIKSSTSHPSEGASTSRSSTNTTSSSGGWMSPSALAHLSPFETPVLNVSLNGKEPPKYVTSVSNYITAAQHQHQQQQQQSSNNASTAITSNTVDFTNKSLRSSGSVSSSELQPDNQRSGFESTEKILESRSVSAGAVIPPQPPSSRASHTSREGSMKRSTEITSIVESISTALDSHTERIGISNSDNVSVETGKNNSNSESASASIVISSSSKSSQDAVPMRSSSSGFNPSPASAESHEVFEREARALQQELAHMQKTLEDRMKKYQKLTRAFPTQSSQSDAAIE